jgi:hypothetical protein
MQGHKTVQYQNFLFSHAAVYVDTTDPVLVKHILKDRFENYSKPVGIVMQFIEVTCCEHSFNAFVEFN